jgi:hypothetical protein
LTAVAAAALSHAATAARLLEQVSGLRERSTTLAAHLACASRELEAGGAVPGVGLVDELDLVRSEFANIRRQTLDLAAAVESGSLPANDDPASLSALDAMLQSISDAVRRQAAVVAKRQALLILERVAQLRHREVPDFEPLQQCQALADELRHAISAVEWPQTPADLSSLADGSHGLAQLVEFVEQQTQLDDVRWELLHDAVATSLGRPLAAAAARGKLGSVSPSTKEDDEDAWPTMPIAAREADRSAGALIWQALLKNRASLAFLSATCLEDGSDGVSNIPVWLLRALALSRHVSYPNGDIALQLAQDFGSYDGVEVAAEGEALCLLVAAAALRPALVAPDTGAWAVLRGLTAGAGLPNFQRYVRCIAEYGERNPAIAQHTLSDELSPVVWRDRMEDLLREVGAWRVRFLGMRSSFAPATEVWRRWLRPDGLIHALLDPLTLDAHGLEAVRGQVERLSNEGQIRWEIADTDRRWLGRRNGPDITVRRDALEQLSERLRESVVFARRWIALQERRPHRPEDEPRRAGLRLKQQLAELRPAAVQELTDAQPAARALPLQAALVQCQAALASVEALLGGGVSDATCVQEPPVPIALYSNLLRVRGPWIDQDWRPTSSRLPASALNGLIDADQLPDWRTTFEQHRRAKDHLATAQVLQCLEMQSADSRELQVARAEDVQQCRAALRHDVELTRDLVDAAAASGRLSEQSRVRLLAVVERIAAAVAASVRFESEHERLHQVRDQLESLEPAPSTDARWREAGPLLLSSLGDARPESPDVVARAVSLANYEPETIQRLGSLLAQRARGVPVTRAVLETVASSHEGAELLTANLRATLDSHPRQLVVMYSLALAYWSPQYDATDLAADGVTSAWLAEHARLWCPNAAASSAVDDFPHVVDEMVAIGVLRSIAQDRLILGIPSLLPYLGTEEELMSMLLEYDKG